MAASALADAPMLSESEPGLAHPRIEPDIAHELLWRGKASDVPDRRDQTRRDCNIDPRDRQKSLDRRIFEAALGDLAIKKFEVLRKPIEFADVPIDRRDLVGRKRLPCQPGSTQTAEKISMGATRHEMRMQDRMNFILDLRAMAHNLFTARHKAS